LSRASGAFSYRPLIWEAAVDELAHPRLEHLVGFGFRGQLGSGVWQAYRCVFVRYAQPQLASVHNAWLQSILDTGYVGLVLTLFFLSMLLVRATSQCFRMGEASFQGMGAIVLYAVLAGTAEATLSPEYHGIFSMLLLLPITLFLNAGGASRD